MNVKNLLKAIITYYEVTRGTGHTQLMLNGAKNKKCIVMTHDVRTGKHLKEANWMYSGDIKFMSINSNSALVGYKLPLAFDNASLFKIFSDALRELETQETSLEQLKLENKELQSKLNEIKSIVK